MELLAAPSIDRAQIESIRVQQLQLADTATRRMTQAMTDAAEVLNPDQRAKLVAKWQQHRGHRRKHSQFDFGLAKLRAIRCNHDVARSNQLAATAECWSINHGDHRFRQLLKHAKDVVERVEHLIDQLLHVLLDRNACAKSAAVFIWRKNNCYQIPSRTIAQRGAYLFQHCDVENI